MAGRFIILYSILYVSKLGFRGGHGSKRRHLESDKILIFRSEAVYIY